MAFRVDFSNGRSCTWFLYGDHILLDYPVTADRAILFDAWGDELAYIVRNCKRLPYTPRFTRWRGSLAQFVWDNLPADSNRPVSTDWPPP